MAEYKSKLDEMASEFIVSTCQLLPKSFSAVSDHMHNVIMTDEPALKVYSIVCGSAAEIYIHPLNTCIADIDFLFSSADELAFSGKFPALPSDISGLPDMVRCYSIEPYQSFPGFVRLRFSGEMIYKWKYKRYTLKHIDLQNSYKTLNMSTLAEEYTFDPVSKIIISGPAMTLRSNEFHHYSSGDFVRSVWCPQWPREAHNWPIRQRIHQWPTVDTICEVLQNGCHVVFVQHRTCRDDREQWRLSFSVAEVTLLQSWTQIQQIIYHLLRFFAKRELIQKNCPKEDEVLCPYHLKTLMLWTCEEMPPEWWNSSSVIAVCCELLNKLSNWIKRRNIPNYFIPEANLFTQPSCSTILDTIVWRIKECSNFSILCPWFEEHYITEFISTHLPVVSGMNLTTLIDILLELRHETEPTSLRLLLSSSFMESHYCCRTVARLGSYSGLRGSLKSGCYRRCHSIKTTRNTALLTTIEDDLFFAYYDNLLHILHSVHSLSFGEISYKSMLFVELVHTISVQPNIIKSNYHNYPKAYTSQDGRFQFQRAQDLMGNLTGSNSRSEFQLIVLLAIWLLREVLEYDDKRSNEITPAALAYLASLYFATAEYQQAKHLCLTFVTDQKPQKNMEAMNAGCLLFIDDIARIVGVFVVHKKITEKNINYIGVRLCLDLRLSPKVFANYLKLLCTERIRKRLYFNYELPDSTFPMDECLTILTTQLPKSRPVAWPKSIAYQIAYHRANSMNETESATVNPVITENTVINCLMEYALENMKSFYDVIRRDFGIQCNTDDCYRALYLYRCRKYDEVMQLCRQILRQSVLHCHWKKSAFANVLLVPPLDLFFDRDVPSLLGFHTMFYCLSPLNDDIRKLKSDARLTFAHFFARIVYYQGDALSCSLSKCFPIRSYYYLGRHFLARYLKVRCCINCNIPYTEALSQFAAHKTQFPFEFIIRRFLLQKLCSSKKD